MLLLPPKPPELLGLSATPPLVLLTVPKAKPEPAALSTVWVATACSKGEAGSSLIGDVGGMLAGMVVTAAGRAAEELWVTCLTTLTTRVGEVELVAVSGWARAKLKLYKEHRWAQERKLPATAAPKQQGNKTQERSLPYDGQWWLP